MSAPVLSVALQGFPDTYKLHELASLVYFTTVNNGFILTMSALSSPPGLLRIHNSRHQEKHCVWFTHTAPEHAFGRPQSQNSSASALASIYSGKLGVIIQQLRNQFGSSPFVVLCTTIIIFLNVLNTPPTFENASSWQPCPSPPLLSGEDEVTSCFSQFQPRAINKMKSRR